MFFEEKISWIPDTPLGIRIRNIELVPTHMHENIIEIILCLQGSVTFCYAYEEFTLSEGEYILIDKDAHYLVSDDRDNICVSFYLDLTFFVKQYPYITNLVFVCEATKGTSRPYPTVYHKQLKGILMALLAYLSKHEPGDSNFKHKVIHGAERIVDILVDRFEIIYYYNPDIVLKDELLERNRRLMVYLREHSAEKITLGSVARAFNLTQSYISEFMRTYGIGFQKILSYTRANNSEKLLLTSDINITDISEACGFSDPKYYYSAFREWYKCTPLQFRKIYRDKMYDKASEHDLNQEDLHEMLNERMTTHLIDLFLD